MNDTDRRAGQGADSQFSKRGQGHSHPDRAAVVFSIGLLAVSVVILLVIPDRATAIREVGPWMVVVLLAASALAETLSFPLVFRRETNAVTIAELPLAFCLVFLTPGSALLAYAVGSASVSLLRRRQRATKLLFNVAMLGLDVTVPVLVFRSLVGALGTSDVVLVAGVVVATFVWSALSVIPVAVVMSFFEGSIYERVAAEIHLTLWSSVLSSTLAGMLVSLAFVSPILPIFATVPVVMMWHVMQAYGALDQRHRDLDAVHAFTGRVGLSLEPAEIGGAAVVEAAEILRADAAALVLFDNGSGAMVKAIGDVGVKLPTRADDPSWGGYIKSETAQLLADQQLLELPGATPATQPLLVASIHDQTGPIGLLAVGSREGSAPRLDEDVTRLQNLTEQLAASLRRGLLHQRIEREAREDRLTGLPNRLAFERALATEMQYGDAEGLLFVIMIDLDRFKEVNDTLGHTAGDELLVTVAERLALQLRPADVLARLAGDEFAIVGRRSHPSEITNLANACVRDSGRPVTLDGLEVVVTASAGVAIVDPADSDGDESTPLRHADIAMFNAKSQHLGVEVYRDEIDRRTPARLSMLGDLRAAIEDQRLQVHLQPKLDLTSGLIVGAEALVRWTHPVRGVVPPSHFVRVAEDTGLIKQLTDLMLRRGIYHIREIHDRGYHLGLSVNLSTHDLLDSRLAGRVEEHLRDNGVDPGMLTLEITESSLLIDAPRARSSINELHEVGVQLSIDDFGTGYSSLSYLRRLPVGELKIDQSFVANVLLDEQDEVIVRSTIDLGHNLGLVVVAEGVENNEVLDRLKALGCDVAQGFCISRPLPPEHLISWLATTSHPSRTVDPLDYTRWNHLGNSGVNPRGIPGANPGQRPVPGAF